VLRSMLVSPLLVVFAAVAGGMICRANGINPHPHEAWLAAIVALLASSAGVFPIIWFSKPTRASGFQAALLGSVLHLAICLGGAGVILVMRRPPDAFVYWMLVLYWLTLFAMCGVFIGRLRSPARPVETLSH
jgi:hypothetical protein